MTTAYFWEKTRAARRIAESSEDPETLVRAWLECDFAWRVQTEQSKPAELVAEREAINGAMRRHEDLGPAPAGEHRGIYQVAVDALPQDELHDLRARVIAFLGVAENWARSALDSSRGASDSD